MFDFHLKWWKTPFFLPTTRQEALISIIIFFYFLKDVTQIDAQKQILFCFVVPE